MPITYTENPLAANLSWTLPSAPNQTGFDVEKSADGVTFTEIGHVPLSQKTFRDATVQPGETAFYRVSTLYGSNVVKVTAPVPATVTSPDGTSVPPAAQILDNNGDAWTLAGVNIMKNGSWAAQGQGVLITKAAGGQIVVTTATGDKWDWTGSGWTKETDPVVTIQTPDAPTNLKLIP